MQSLTCFCLFFTFTSPQTKARSRWWPFAQSAMPQALDLANRNAHYYAVVRATDQDHVGIKRKNGIVKGLKGAFERDFSTSVGHAGADVALVRCVHCSVMILRLVIYINDALTTSYNQCKQLTQEESPEEIQTSASQPSVPAVILPLESMALAMPPASPFPVGPFPALMAHASQASFGGPCAASMQVKPQIDAASSLVVRSFKNLSPSSLRQQAQPFTPPLLPCSSIQHLNGLPLLAPLSFNVSTALSSQHSFVCFSPFPCIHPS